MRLYRCKQNSPRKNSIVGLGARPVRAGIIGWDIPGQGDSLNFRRRGREASAPALSTERQAPHDSKRTGLAPRPWERRAFPSLTGNPLFDNFIPSLKRIRMMKRRGTPPKILPEKCTLCGQCVTVCPSYVIDFVEGKVEAIRGEWCIGCGHCGAVCPTEAVLQEATSFEGYPGGGSAPATSPETLGLLLRERRSIRNYSEAPVPKDILQEVLEAGRYAPTGSNSQNVHYIVLSSSEQISQLKSTTLAFYEKIFSWVRGRLGSFLMRLVAGRKTLAYLRGSLPKVEYAHGRMKRGKDILFYHAPVVILAHAESWDSSSSFNCSVALYNCSLMAHTLGLGCCFNGFLVNAANHDRKIKKWLGIPPDHKCYAALTLGYQQPKYRRLVHRAPPKVIWR